MSAIREGDAVAGAVGGYAYSGNILAFRAFAWIIVAATLVFILNNYLTLKQNLFVAELTIPINNHIIRSILLRRISL